MTNLSKSTTQLMVYGRRYDLRVIQKTSTSIFSPRLVVVAYQPNETAKEILRLCLDSIRHHTPEEHELWVVDNASPIEMASWLAEEPGINVIFNRTQPEPPFSYFRRLVGKRELYKGSYANAVALELAARIIDSQSKLMMTLHMDTMACYSGWLSYLMGHINDECRCAGVRLDSTRVETVHVLGMLFDFTLFKKLHLSFAHKMPFYDTGDRISLSMSDAGYNIWACRNTLWEPELIEYLPIDSPFRDLNVDRSLNDKNQVIFLHLGRGVLKSHQSKDAETNLVQEWLDFGRKIVLQS